MDFRLYYKAVDEDSLSCPSPAGFLGVIFKWLLVCGAGFCG